MGSLKTFKYYSHEDWDVMEQAHRSAFRELAVSATAEEKHRRLAKRVMTLFDRGLRDENVIAAAAVRQERVIEETLSLRSNSQGS